MGRRGSRGQLPDLAKLARRAAADAKGTDPALLDGYLELLVVVRVTVGGALTPAEIDDRRAAGRTAAEWGVPSRVPRRPVPERAWSAWPLLPRRAGEQSDALATTLLRAANDAIVALIVGHESAQRLSINMRQATPASPTSSSNGTGTAARLLELAALFGLQLAGAHGRLAATATTPFADGDERTRRW